MKHLIETLEKELRTELAIYDSTQPKLDKAQKEYETWQRMQERRGAVIDALENALVALENIDE